MRRGPARPTPIMPPMVPLPDTPSSMDVSIGSHANCWFLESISDCPSARRGAGLHRDDQFVRLVGRDRIQRRQIEQRIGRDRLADLALRTMADDFKRLL